MPLAIGLMSGTSINGIDAALVRLSGRGNKIKIRLLDFAIYPFPKAVKEKILQVAHPANWPSVEICRLNFQLGHLFADAVRRLCRKNRLALRKIDFISSHGQTVCHLGGAGTLQIAEPSVIAEKTGITTVADFRPRDVAAGGHGAPLAPFFHYLFFRDPKRDIAVHNIGGISNLTFIPKGASIDRVIGFDTGPGNMVIDGLMNELSSGAERGSGFASPSAPPGGHGETSPLVGEDVRHCFRGGQEGRAEVPALGGAPRYYDHGGKIASRGIVSLRLLKELLSHPFILKKPPKTSGREEFGRPFVRRILRRGRAMGLKSQDLVATATALTAVSIAENYRKFVFKQGIPDEIIFGGGGIHNASLMRMIRAEIPEVTIRTFDDYGMPADAAEAVCFAVLAYKTLLGEPANLPSVTGASHPVILGKIIPGARGMKVSPSRW